MSTNQSDVILSHIDSEQRNIFTTIPAIVSDVSKLSSNKVSVQPALQELLPDGSSEDLTILVDLPIQWPAGGGAVMTFPIAVGDTVLVVFSMRSIADFQVSVGGTVAPFDDRLHNLSDGYVIPGIFREVDQPSPNTDDVILEYNDSVITIKKDGTILLDRNGTGTYQINPDGTHTNTTSSTWSMTNGTTEMIDMLIQILRSINTDTVNTIFGTSPLNSAIATEALIVQLETFKE